jgi:hypothetical protein
MKKERMLIWHEKAKIMPVDLKVAIDRHVVSLTVVCDPLGIEEGGFEPGATFGKNDWMQMFQRFSFTPGTVLKDGQGRLYEFRSSSKVGVK